MITVNVSQLISAIKEAGVFKIPDMSKGTDYLYNNLYKRLSRGESVTLSSINFVAFDPDDIDALNSLHSDIFERDSYTANGIMSTLKKITPVSMVAAYV